MRCCRGFGRFHCFDETTVVAAGDAVSTAVRATDMGVLIEVVGVSVPVCGFHLDHCWYWLLAGSGFPHWE